MSIEKPLKIGSDPVTVFDVKHGTAIHSSLSYQVQHAAGAQTCDGDLVVSVSNDGGLSWLKPVVVDDGIGCDFSKLQLFNDKEWIVTDNNSGSPYYGRTYLTWSKFESAGGDYVSSAIWEAHSDDGGFYLDEAEGDLRVERRPVHLPARWAGRRVRPEPVLGADGRAGRDGVRRLSKTSRTRRSGRPASSSTTSTCS